MSQKWVKIISRVIIGVLIVTMLLGMISYAFMGA